MELLWRDADDTGGIEMEDILTFTTPENRWLSNMTYVDIEHQGIVYPSTENFYQAIKYDKDDISE